MIPTVKLWRIRLEQGGEQLIWAPTRRLALLNYRFDFGFAPIRSIGLVRGERGQAVTTWKGQAI